MNKTLLIFIALLISFNGCDNSKVLEISSITPNNNTKNIELDTNIVMMFNKSIDEDSTHNISLLDTQCNAVKMDIQVIGSRVMLNPINNLSQNTKYVLKIKKTLKSRDGDSLGKVYYFSFITQTNRQELNKIILNNELSTIKLSTRFAIEVALDIGIPLLDDAGIPIRGGESLDVEVYDKHLMIKYSETLTKIKYSSDIPFIDTLGVVNGNTAKIIKDGDIPMFIEIYFNKNGNSISKIFEIQKNTSCIPTTKAPSVDNQSEAEPPDPYAPPPIIGHSNIATLMLKTGWNLISSPTNIDFNTNLITKIDNKNIYSLINNQWHRAYGKIMPPYQGFWVKVTEDENIAFNKVNSNRMKFQVEDGWNLLGMSNPSERINDILSILNGSAIWEFKYSFRKKRHTWRKRTISDRGSIYEGHGFWLEK